MATIEELLKSMLTLPTEGKKGDFVVVRPNSGTRIKIHGKEFRIINDDTVEAVVQDPRGFSRA